MLVLVLFGCFECRDHQVQRRGLARETVETIEHFFTPRNLQFIIVFDIIMIMKGRLPVNC